MSVTYVVDIPKLFTAFAEWGSCVLFLFLLPNRISRKLQVLSAAVYLAILIPYELVSASLSIYFWIPYMIGALLMMYLFLLLNLNAAWKDVAFCAVRAFVLAEFAASLHWQIYVWAADTFGIEGEITTASIVSMAVIYAVVGIIYYMAEKSHFPTDNPLNVNLRELSACFVTALFAFAMSNLSFLSIDTPFSGVSTSYLYIRSLVDLGGLLMLYTQQDRREELRINSENMAINTILQHQYDQYRISIENTERLKREMHDLKHYMIALRTENDPAKKEEYLNELENAILIDESMSNTGNSVLDVILTTKNTYCLQNNISLTSLVDGSLLSKLYVKDICSIFGNMLDNAIECVSMYEDRDKRLVNLSVRKVNDFVMIECENCSDEAVTFDYSGLPQSTKKDNAYHGYGLKSIRYAISKYNGRMTIKAENGWFTVRVLLPE